MPSNLSIRNTLCTMRVPAETYVIRIPEESWAIVVSISMLVFTLRYKYLSITVSILKVCVLQLIVVILNPFVIKYSAVKFLVLHYGYCTFLNLICHAAIYYD